MVGAILARHTGWSRALIGGLGAQLITHPALWYAVPRFEPYVAWLVVAELGVLLVEAVVYVALLRRDRMPWRPTLVRAFLASTLANSLSLAVGLVLDAFGVW